MRARALLRLYPRTDSRCKEFMSEILPLGWPCVRHLLEQAPQCREVACPQALELAGMEGRHRLLQLLEEAEPVAGYSRRHHASVERLASAADPALLLQAVEQPRDVWIPADRALRDGAAGESARAAISQDSQHVVLLRRDAGGPEQDGELLDLRAGHVLEQKVDLALRRLDGIEQPHSAR